VPAAADTYSGQHGLSANDALAVDGELTSIQKTKGRLTTAEMAEELVRRAKAPGSSTHHLFEWSDKKAAEQQRLDRAKFLIRCVYVTLTEAPDVQPVRKWITLTEGGKKGPTSIRKVLTDEDLTAALLEQAKADIEVWSNRYERFRELADLKGVFRAIDKINKRNETTGRGRKKERSVA
jgi:hypothetical protein